MKLTLCCSRQIKCEIAIHACCTLLVLLSYARTSASEFIPLGGFLAYGLSDDGRIIAGQSEEEAALWTDEDGIVGIGYLRGDKNSRANGISGDGTVVVGQSGLRSETEAFRWTTDSGMSGLGKTANGFATVAADATRDGNTIVGRTRDSSTFRAWYWTEAEGVIDMSKVLSSAIDISADGRVVVGNELNVDSGNNQAFRWTREDGIQLFVPPVSPNINPRAHQARSVSADGSSIVGSLWESDNVSTPFLWVGEEKRLLGRFATDRFSDNSPLSTTPSGVSNAGEIVVGGGFTNELVSKAFLWNENEGLLELQTVLKDEYDLGDSLEGWQLRRATEISPNGRFIIGSGTNPQGDNEFWLARLDYPYLGTPIIGDFNHDQVVDVLDLDALGVAIQANASDLKFDLDESGAVESADINAMVETLLGTWIGDSNLDGEFNSRDLVTVFQSSQYEDSIDGNSTWETGDWNLDGDFTTADLVFAFQDGGYEKGPRTAVAAVPEPTSAIPALIGLLLLNRRRFRD